MIISLIGIGFSILAIAYCAIIRSKINSLFEQSEYLDLKLSSITKDVDGIVQNSEREIYRYIAENNKDVFQSMDMITKKISSMETSSKVTPTKRGRPKKNKVETQ